MSWIKRRGQATSPNASTGPPVQMYNPNQHSNLHSQWQQQDLQAPVSNWYNQTQPNQNKSYPQPQQQSNYWQQPYNPATQPTQNQNTTTYNQYSQAPTGFYQNPGYEQQNPQAYNYNKSYEQTYNPTEQQPKQPEGDTWNWGWGDEDNSNIQSLPPSGTNINHPTNSVANAFGNDESWNWSLDEANSTASNLTNQKQDGYNNTVPSSGVDSLQNLQHFKDRSESLFPKMGSFAEKNSHSLNSDGSANMQVKNIQTPNVGENKPTENYSLSPDHLLTASKNGKINNKIDHLTPQWSTESQMSQDSSDNVLHTSESDKSHGLSRSSTVSGSPISGHDTNVETAASVNLQQPQSNQLPAYSPTNLQNAQDQVGPYSNYYTDASTQNYNIQHENREVLSNLRENQDGKISKTNPTPPPPMKIQTPPLSSLQTAEDMKNPYKRSPGLSHKVANKFKNETPQQNLHMIQPNCPVAPSSFNQSVNLETLPDNSEQPDPLPLLTNQPVRSISRNKTPVQQWPDNNEIAPINDRNQYLETGQLSNVDFNQPEFNNQLQVENMDLLPPPGLRRMVLGQLEQTDNSLNNDSFTDEPPPGLSRMVLGQTGSNSALIRNPGETSELPIGLHRMVPGESSSPESNTFMRPQAYTQVKTFKEPAYLEQQQAAPFQDAAYRHESRLEDDYISEAELNQPITSQTRSATIGADTPPTVTNNQPLMSSQSTNRSETIGADTSLSYGAVNSNNRSLSASSESRVGAVGYSSNVRKTQADGANTLDETAVVDNNRRDSVEGQPQDNEINNLVNIVRDLTVGENPTDNVSVGAVATERSNRKTSRHESTDSEQERENRGKSPKTHRDRKYRDDDRHDKERFGDKGRTRYSPSPDQYRSRKYERRRYRDKRYDDDTDYNSDKERDRRRDEKERREDLERKYSSLKREKDKQRKDYRETNEYSREPRRHDNYYNRYDDEYEEVSRSRPSSRSDSMHDSYREKSDRERRKDKERHRRHHDPYNAYAQGYGYDPYNQYYQQYQYQYYENLRRTNPRAYAELYNKYYQQNSATTGYGPEERASVHSGRSSANDELAKERPFDQTDSSLNFEESRVSSRMTPAKFATAHIKASIISGRLIKILPHYPLDGQTATVELCNLQDLLMHDDELKELTEFPGPLTKGITHKKTIIEYCESKIRNAIHNRDIVDTDSYILMWELLILLLRQNGTVVGTDIAELLMKDRKPEISRRQSVTSNSSSLAAEGANASETNSLPMVDGPGMSTASLLKEDVITNKFRDYLIYGSDKEALEWAMKHGLWGHALFLASKLDKRTYANVMTRFANGLTMNDPLQTLYQLLSGRLPASVTCVADEKWGDWRPHLAMILSNTSQRPELHRKAITTLADTLLGRGSLYAAQFCYLMAQVGFSRYGAEGAKLVLLGSNQSKPFMQFATNEAIHMTEVYEYACTLNDIAFVIPEFQPYKYLIATRLADRGLLEKSLAYLEKLATAILQNPAIVQPSILNRVCELADQLKYYDPVGDPDVSEGDLDISRPDNSWLRDLKVIQNEYNMGLMSHANHLIAQTPELEQQHQTHYEKQLSGQESWQQQYEQQQFQQSGDYGQWQPHQQIEQSNVGYQEQQDQTQEGFTAEQYQEQQRYWASQQQQQWGGDTDNHGVVGQYNQLSEQQNQNDAWNTAHAEEVASPQISMPNQSKGLPYDVLQDSTSTVNNAKKDSPLKTKPPIPKQNKAATTGWFGGIWNKLSLRPKNQMKLPDDKNPSILWDENKKRWVNTDEDADGGSTEFKPPPKMSAMFNMPQPLKQQADISYPNVGGIPSNNQQGGLSQQPITTKPIQTAPIGLAAQTHQNIAPGHTFEEMSQNASSAHVENPSLATKPPQPNMFKLQRGRNLKKSYVDVFNPNGKSSGNGPLPAPDAFGTTANNGNQMNFFIPAPVTDPNAPTDFLTPAPTFIDDNSQQT